MTPARLSLVFILLSLGLLEHGGTAFEHGGRTLQHGGTTLQQGGTTLQNGGTTLQQGGTTLEQGGTTIEQGGTTLEHDGTTLEHDGTTLQHDGTTLEHDGTTLEHDGTTLEHDGTTLEHDGTPLEHDGTTIEHEGRWTEAKRGGSSSSSSQQPKNCEPSHLQGCMDQLQAINKDHNLAFASTEAELNKMCSTMEAGLDCVHSHVTRCFDKNRQRVIYQLLTGTEDIIKSLCMAGNFRDQYLVHAACMRNLSTDNLVCGNQYKRLISTVSPPEKLNFEDSIRQQCCAFHNYLLCVTSAAERECGTQAAHFIEKYSYRTAGPIIQTRCKVYVPGSLECTHNSAALSRASILLAFSLLLLAPPVALPLLL